MSQKLFVRARLFHSGPNSTGDPIEHRGNQDFFNPLLVAISDNNGKERQGDREQSSEDIGDDIQV